MPMPPDHLVRTPTTRARAVGRSLRIYYAPGRARALDGFYRRFLGPGALAFDVGAHVGDRTGSFRRLGATVVAVEPQPDLVRLLRRLFRRDGGVSVMPTLVGSANGSAELWVNRRNPTISTASQAFIAAADGAAGWDQERWDECLSCPVTTLDALVEAHGMPDFIKLDIEGFEAEALAGLSHPPPALSFEFTTIQRDVALASVLHLQALGYRWFNACLGESMRLVEPRPMDAGAVADWLSALPQAANSGDVYACVDPSRLMTDEG